MGSVQGSRWNIEVGWTADTTNLFDDLVSKFRLLCETLTHSDHSRVGLGWVVWVGFISGNAKVDMTRMLFDINTGDDDITTRCQVCGLEGLIPISQSHGFPSLKHTLGAVKSFLKVVEFPSRYSDDSMSCDVCWYHPDSVEEWKAHGAFSQNSHVKSLDCFL